MLNSLVVTGISFPSTVPVIIFIICRFSISSSFPKEANIAVCRVSIAAQKNQNALHPFPHHKTPPMTFRENRIAEHYLFFI